MSCLTRTGSNQSEYKAAAGPDGWTAQQGFYVYRNERLLVAGSWLGLGQRAVLDQGGGSSARPNPRGHPEHGGFRLED